MSQYIPEDKFKIDEIVEQVIGTDTMTQYYAELDSQIERWCWKRGVTVDNIPVDVNGYVTSPILESVGVYYLLYRVCMGYAGSGMGNSYDDVYAVKMKNYKELYKDELAELTQETILGDTDEIIPANNFNYSIQIEY